MEENNNPNPKGGGGMEKTVKFLVGKGFYIVLFLCLAAIGISGYVILFSQNSAIDPNLDQIPGINLGSTVNFGTTGASEKNGPRESEQPVAAQTKIPEKTSRSEKETLATPGSTLAPETSEKTGETEEKTPSSVEKLFYTSPVSGDITNLFSGDVPVFNPTMSDWRVHSGVDIFAPVGTEVSSVGKGVVKRVYRDEFKGVCVEIEHPDGLTSVYCGLEDEVPVSAGDETSSETVIGTVGTTAAFEFSDGPHLHLEFREGGVAVDPLEYFYQGN